MYNPNMPEGYTHELMPTRNYYMTEDYKEEEQIDYDKLTEEEKINLFKEELRKMGVTNTWKWDDANRVVQDSKHYHVLPAISHKKQAFFEYVKDFNARLEQNKRENKQKQINEYYEMLDQVQELNVLSKFHECIKYFQTDRRFLQLDEKDREEYFQDYMDELEDRELKRKQEHSKRKIDALKNLFQSHEVNTATKFEEAKELFKNNAIFNSADKLDQLKAFSEYITEKVDEEEEIEYKQRIRQERKNREKFRELMQELVNDKKLLHSSHWKDIVPLIKDDDRYKNLLLQGGSRPVEIFRDFQEQEKEKFNVHKVAFKSLLKTKSIKLGADISKEDFNQNLSMHEEYANFSEDIKDQLYEYYIYKVNQKKETNHKAPKKEDSHKSGHKRSRSRKERRGSHSDDSHRDRRKHSHRKRSHKSKRRRSRSSRREVEDGEYVGR